MDGEHTLTSTRGKFVGQRGTAHLLHYMHDIVVITTTQQTIIKKVFYSRALCITINLTLFHDDIAVQNFLTSFPTMRLLLPCLIAPRRKHKDFSVTGVSTSLVALPV